MAKYSVCVNVIFQSPSGQMAVEQRVGILATACDFTVFR